MSAKKKETAEQKLLKMIEASSGSEQSAKTQKSFLHQQNLLSMIKLINKGLVVAIIVCVILLLNEYRAGSQLMGQSIEAKVDASVSGQVSQSDHLLPVIQQKDFYLANVSARNMFEPFEVKTERIETVKVENRRIVQQTRNFKLVGIAWLDDIDSASVMIEDTEKEVTYFLKKEEKIGDIVVKTIYADSAVLGYENEEMIIKYDKNQI